MYIPSVPLEVLSTLKLPVVLLSKVKGAIIVIVAHRIIPYQAFQAVGVNCFPPYSFLPRFLIHVP